MDVPGFMVGTKVEEAGIIRHGAKMLYATANATVPKVTVVLRKAYGAGYYVMCGRAFEPDVIVAWPSAEISVMGAEGAVEIIFRKQVEAAEDPAAKKQELIDNFRKIIDVYIAAGNDMIDDVIDPRETRATICRALELAATQARRAPVEALRGGPGLTPPAPSRRCSRRWRWGRCGSTTHSTTTPVKSGPGQKTFSAPGMAIHFQYPASFHKVELAQSKRVAGNTGNATHAAVGTGPFDLLIVTRFPKRPIPVTAQNIAKLKPQFDAAVSSALGRHAVGDGRDGRRAAGALVSAGARGRAAGPRDQPDHERVRRRRRVRTQLPVHPEGGGDDHRGLRRDAQDAERREVSRWLSRTLW